MVTEIIKAIIAIVIIIAALVYPETREYSIPAIGIVIGYYFGRGDKTMIAMGRKK